jgi:tetratricopeptide (TPR) repeat protein
MPYRKILLFVLVLPLPALAAAAPDPQHYRLCLNAAKSNPSAALVDAESWAKAGGGVPAQHCGAVALVGLKRYAEAAVRLDKLGSAKDLPDASFRTELFDQAGNAWLLAGNGAKAVQSFSAALTLSAGDPDLFADLARAQAMRKNWAEVELDMNAALQITPHRADLLVLRASARRARGRFAEARADIVQALKLNPGDGIALVESGLLRREMGDIGGARRDFQAALKTSSAPEAKENLDALGPG